MDEADDGSDSDRDESAATPDAGEPFDPPGADEPTSDDPEGSGSDRPSGGRTVDAAASSAASDAGSPEDGNGDGLREEVRELRDELAALEDSVEDRTVHRSEVEADLKRYVRRRLRRGHARGWGPYLVLLYGTVMTIGAFYSPVLSSGWAIFAMIVIWLSTLGLYVLMVLVGVGIELLNVPGKALDFVRSKR